MRQTTLAASIQKLVPSSLRPTILYLAQRSTLAGLPGKRRKYESLHHENYWSNMATNVYSTFKSCTDSPTMGTKFSHQRIFELFLPSGPLELIAVNILEPLPRTRSGKQFVVIITDMYSNLARVVTSTKLTLTQVANTFSTTALSLMASLVLSYLIMNSSL